MSYGPITHAGSNWRKLCARYNLDPLAATAGDVEQAIRLAVITPVKDAGRKISEALAVSDEWGEWERLSGDLQEAIGELGRVIDAAQRREVVSNHA